VGHGFSFRMAYAPLLVPEPTGDRDRDLLAFVTAMNERLEWLIQQAPEQYLWIHDRYREGARPAVGGDDEGSDDAE
jgi:lauroyl/myristoyl acyltransferase